VPAVVEQRGGEVVALAELAERARNYARSSKAPNTLRAYESDLRHFGRWCEARSLTAFPAEPETVARHPPRQGARPGDEQAALRRVATLVAKQTPHAEVFAAIAEEIGRLLAVDSIEMIRYEGDRVAAVVAGWGALALAVPIGTRVPLGGRNVTSLVFRTQRAPPAARSGCGGRGCPGRSDA
jgi:hypothetical protein